MGTRLERVEALLQREIASVVLTGELRDPRVQPTSNVSITGVSCSPDLSSARVFVDVLDRNSDLGPVLAGLNAGAAEIQRQVGRRITLKRTPRLRFLEDEGIRRGARIEQVLDELRRQGDGEGESR